MSDMSLVERIASAMTGEADARIVDALVERLAVCEAALRTIAARGRGRDALTARRALSGAGYVPARPD